MNDWSSFVASEEYRYTLHCLLHQQIYGASLVIALTFSHNDSLYFSVKLSDTKSRFEDGSEMFPPCLRIFEMIVSSYYNFYLEVEGNYRLGSAQARMSSPSSKRLSASAHFADKKGIQLSPSIYLVSFLLPLLLSPIPCSLSTYLWGFPYTTFK